MPSPPEIAFTVRLKSVEIRVIASLFESFHHFGTDLRDVEHFEGV